MQDSKAATSAGAGACAVGRREHQGTDRTTTTTRVSSNAGATIPIPMPFRPLARLSPSPSPSLLHLSSAFVYGPILRKRLRSVHSRQPFFLLHRHRVSACVPLSRHRQSSHPRSRTRAPPDVPRLQRYLPDRVSRLVLNGAIMCFAESSLSIEFIRRVAKFPNPDAPGVPGRNWVLDAVAYIVSWVLWLFGVFLMRSSTLIIVDRASVSSYGFDVLEDWAYRRLHPGRPLILPIYLSSPPSALSPCHPMTTSAFSSTFALRHFPTSTRLRSSLRQRARCAMRSQRRAIFMCRTFRVS